MWVSKPSYDTCELEQDALIASLHPWVLVRARTDVDTVFEKAFSSATAARAV